MKKSISKGKKITAIGLCAAMAVSGGVMAYGRESTESQKTLAAVNVYENGKREAVLGALLKEGKAEGTDTKTTEKDETVYVIASTDGSVKKVLVSDWIKNPEGKETLEDETSLKDLSNVADHRELKEEDGKVVYAAEGRDMYVMGESDAPLPVELALSCELDGKSCTLNEAAGKSGHLLLRITYTNKETRTVTIGDHEETIHVPFLMGTGFVAENEKMRNIKVSQGTVLNDGEKSIVAGLAVPGLSENLTCAFTEKENLSLPLSDELVIEADVTDFTVPVIMTVGLTDLMEVDSSEGETKFSEITDSLEKLSDAATALKDGSKELSEGLNTLYEKVCEFSDGVGAVKDGAGKVSEGAGTLADGLLTLQEKSGDLADGINRLTEGSRTLSNGLSSLFEGAQTLSDGIGSAKTGADSLAAGLGALTGGSEKLSAGAAAAKTGADTLSGGMTAVSEGAGKLSEGANQLEAGTKALYAGSSSLSDNTAAFSEKVQELSGATGSLAEAAVSVKDGAAALSAGIESTCEGLAKTIAADKMVLSALEAQKEQMGETPELSQMIAVLSQSIAGNEQILVLLSKDGAIGQGAMSLSAGTEKLSLGAGAIASGSEALAEKSSLLSGGAKTLSEAAGQVAAGSESLAAGLTNLNSNLPAVVAGTESLAEGLQALQAGSEEITGHLKEAEAGADSLADGLGKLSEGGKTLTEGAKAAEEGSLQVTEGLNTLSDGKDALIDGINRLTEGAVTLSEGAKSLSEGTNQLSDGCAALLDGVSQLKDGGLNLADGMDEFYTEGIEKITSLFGEELSEFLERLKAVADLTGSYNSYAGKPDDWEGKVKFVYKIED